MSDMNGNKYPRIFLWASHRTLSTAFFRAMEGRSDVKGMIEPYSLAYFFGPERRTSYFDGKNVHPDTSMREQLMLIENMASKKLFHQDSNIYSIKHIWKLYKLIKSQQAEKYLFVIDSDDFLENPEEILRSYCTHVGLEYQTSMLSWGDKSDTVLCECVWSSWFGDALNSKTIDRNITDTNSKMKDYQTLPDFIVNAIEDDMKYYRKLLAVKFRL